MKTIADARLYTFVDTAYFLGRAPADIAQQLCDGGSDVIQIRAKNHTPDQVRLLAAAVKPVLDRAGVPLVINDFWEVALDVGAAICHLGQEDFFDAGLSRSSQLKRINARPLLGLSTHAPAQALRALEAEPDYIAIGPIYSTATKPTAKPVTLDYVRWAKENVKIPWFAIGGVNMRTLDAVLEAGASRICVVSDILNAPDIAKACRAFRDRLG
jgi:thiamine-phosphate pyrophosphorylase